MIRHAAAIALLICASTSRVTAQQPQHPVFTVNVPSANIYKSPSTGSPVIGHASRGRALDVSRELGSWVRVAWPDAADGVGYVHVTMGSLGAQAEATRAAAAAVPPPAPGPRQVSTTAPQRQIPPRVALPEPRLVKRPAPPAAAYVRPPTHILGIGGGISGATFGYGASARAWRPEGKIGAQIAFSRAAVDSIDASGRVASTRVEPSLLYSPIDRVTEAIWLRPYVGAGVGFGSRTLTRDDTLGGPLSDHANGAQLFGGAEFTVPSVPRFALSADIGYRWPHAPFAGVDLGGIGVAVAGHWYVK
jgi:hypothetical protein